MKRVSGRIFRRKWLENMKVQFEAIRLVIDWTVALYIIVPAIVIGTLQYMEWMRETPAWLENIPTALFAIALAIIVCLGHVRWFLDEADALFLLQREGWIKKIKRTGAFLSVLQQTIKLGIVLVVVIPLIHDQTWLRVDFFVFVIVYQVWMMAVKCYGHDFSGWRRIVVRSLTFILGIGLFLTIVWGLHAGIITEQLLIGLTGLLALVAWLMLTHRAAEPYYFTIDAEVDHYLKMKLPALLLSQTISRKESKLRRPLLFRRSRQLLSQRTPDHIYAEMAVKAFYRDSHKVRLYLGVIGVGSTAILLTPLLLKPVVFLLLHALLIPIINQHVKDLLTSDFSEQVLHHGEKETFIYRGRSVVNRWIHVPAFAVFSAVLLQSLFFYGVMRLLQV